jgi:hypothetical protein
MLYLLDTSVLITARNTYYPLDAVPEFWSWLVHMGTTGRIKIPVEIHEEVKDGGTDEKDLLYGWVSDDAVKAALLLQEEVDPALVDRVVREGYADNMTDDEIELIGRDPFLIAYALASASDRCVVTTEVSKPSRRGHNRHIPDVCATMGVQCCDTFAMLRALSFRTNWKG